MGDQPGHPGLRIERLQRDRHQLPVPAEPDADFHPLTHWRVGSSYTSECPGYDAGGLPRAAPGHLCVYQTNQDANSGVATKTALWSKIGIQLAATSSPSTSLAADGAWAVTAP